jgi:glutathione S-transferase
MSPKQVLEIASQGAPGWERGALGAVFPLAARYLRWRLKVTDAGVFAGLRAIDESFADVAARLSDGRPYLAGDRLSAADLTFAALAAPVLMPRGYGIRLPDLGELPPPMRRTVERYRDTPAGRFALRLFETERHPV